MPEPRLTRKRVLAAKAETTPGTAEALTAAEAPFVVYDAEIQPAIDFDDRPADQGSFSQPAGVTAGEKGTATFTIDMISSGSGEGIDLDAPVLQFRNVQAGSRNKIDIEDIEFQLNKSAAAGDDELTITFGGLSTLPAWAATFLPACGFVASGRVYSPKSAAPVVGGDVKTLTIGGYLDGVYKVLKGCAGTFVIRLTNAMRAKLEFTFNGVWVAPADVAILEPTWPTLMPLRFKGSAFTLTEGSDVWTPKISEVSIDIGNELVMREDANESTGYVHAMIVDRKITGSMNPEAVLVATETPYADWLYTVGSTAGLLMIVWLVLRPRD